MAGFEHFIAWQRTFLAARGLERPDGRALYAYRAGDEEFAALEALLNKWVGTFQNLAALGDFVIKIAGLAPLFVLYAAEWWRRRYDGAHWTWGPIVRGFGGDPNQWTQAQRSECVRAGLRYWRLQVRDTGGLRYLGSIALQGGLPMRLLAEARGNIGRLLRTVLLEAARSNAGTSEIQGWIQSLDRYLPQTYRQTEIHLLLAQVVETVLQLRREANLTQAANAVQVLDRHDVQWQQRFPLPVGDDDAQGLIKQLIADAADARVVPAARHFVVGRCIERSELGEWVLHSTVEFPTAVSVDELARLLACDSADLPRFLDASICAGDVRAPVQLRRMAGHQKYRVERAPWSATGLGAAAEHVIVATSADGRSWSLPMPSGQALDDDLPWVFEGEGESRGLLRQGSGGVLPGRALVALPNGWRAHGDGQRLPVFDQRLSAPSRELGNVEGDVRLSGPDAGTCRIRTGVALGAREQYHLQGHRHWEAFVSPPVGYISRPILTVADGDAPPRRVDGAIAWRPLAGTYDGAWNPVGPVEIRYPANGEIRHRSRMVVLPGESRLIIEPGDARSGRIRFTRWGATHGAVGTDGVTADQALDGDALVLSLSTQSPQPPTHVDVDLYWKTTPVPAHLRLPFPARGVLILGGDGRTIPNGSTLAANALPGVRMRSLRAQAAAPLMLLELCLANTQLRKEVRIRGDTSALVTEVRLHDYVTEIGYLLAATDSLDAKVEVRFRLGGRCEASLTVARFGHVFQRLETSVELDPQSLSASALDDLAALNVSVMRLDEPDLEPIVLQPYLSESIPTGRWEFSPQARAPGPWLIYPHADSPIQFRPLLWTVPGMRDERTGLASAISEPDANLRPAAIEREVKRLAKDLHATDWEEVEKLAKQIGHLPLPTVDLWKCFARSSDGMAAMSLRLGAFADSFILRFAVELPFAWETVTYASWHSAISRLRALFTDWYGDGAGIALDDRLSTRFARITTASPAVNNLLNCARAGANGGTPREMTLFRAMGTPGIALRLFQGADCSVQHLYRRHADDGDNTRYWPTQLNATVEDARRDPAVAAMLHPQTLDYRSSVVNLPLMLATCAARNKTGSWFRTPSLVRDLREYIAFDPDWFADGYEWTIARCVATDQLTPEGPA